jgi:aspartyl protease family protein
MSRLMMWIALAVLGGGLILLIVNDSSGETLGLANDDFSRVLYLGVLGAVIALGIWRSRHMFGDTLRNLAVWLLVVLVLVAGYQYRYELQDIASRVTVGLVPGSPLSITDSDGRTTVTLDKLQDGHFGAEIVVDGVPIMAMVDTGASATVLTSADARLAGFDPDRLNFSIPVSTANGVAQAARVTAGEIRVGAISRKNLPVLVASDGALTESLLGMNFIGTLSGFDVRGDRMILRD